MVPGQRFCPGCGAAVAGEGVSGSALIQDIQSKRKLGMTGLIALIAGLAALSVFFAVNGFLTAQANKPPTGLAKVKGEKGPTGIVMSEGEDAPTGLTQIQGDPPPNDLTQIQGEPPPTGVAQVQAPDEVTMPEDIRRYLEFLEAIEKERVRLAKNQISEAMLQLTQLQGLGGMADMVNQLADPDDVPKPNDGPRKQVETSAHDVRAAWRALSDKFAGTPPPSECLTLRNNYEECLTSTGRMVSEILDNIRQAADNPQKALSALQNMQGTSGDRIDVYGKKADNQVQDICDKYKTKKWFSITGDVGGGGLLGNGGLGGLGGFGK